MGFFTALAPLLAQGPLSVRISNADDGKVKLLIVQEAEEKSGEGVPLPPLRHIDTPEKLDETLEAEFVALAAHRAGPVQSMLDQAKALMDEAAAEEKRQAEERLAKSRSKSGAAKSATANVKAAEKSFSLEAESDPEEEDAVGEGANPAASEAPSPAVSHDASKARSAASAELFS